MASVKAECHQVDCDKATGAGGEWESDQTGGVHDIAGATNSKNGKVEFWDSDYAIIPALQTATNSQAEGIDISPTTDYVYAPTQVVNGTTNCMRVFTPDGVLVTSVDFLAGDYYTTLTDGFTRTMPKMAKVDADGAYVYVLYTAGATLSGRGLIKWRISDGTPMWCLISEDDGAFTGYAQFELDNTGRLHIISEIGAGEVSHYTIRDPDDASVLYQWKISAAGTWGGLHWEINPAGTRLYGAYQDDLYEWDLEAADGEGTLLSQLQKETHLGETFERIIWLYNNIYVVDSGGPPNNAVHLIDPTDLSTIVKSQRSFGTDFAGGWVGADAVKVNGDATKIVVFNSEGVTEMNLSLTDASRTLTATATAISDGGAYQHYAMYPDILRITGGDRIALSTQYRTIAYPEDWAHLEGQTVQVCIDGIYLGDDVVSGGQITLDD